MTLESSLSKVEITGRWATAFTKEIKRDRGSDVCGRVCCKGPEAVSIGHQRIVELGGIVGSEAQRQQWFRDGLLMSGWMSVLCVEKENARVCLAFREIQIYLWQHNYEVQSGSFRKTWGVGRKPLKTFTQSSRIDSRMLVTSYGMELKHKDTEELNWRYRLQIFKYSVLLWWWKYRIAFNFSFPKPLSKYHSCPWLWLLGWVN